MQRISIVACICFASSLYAQSDYLVQAYDCLTLNQLEQAGDMFERARKQNPFDAQVYVGLGDLFIKKEQYAHAVCCYEQALDFDPMNVAAHTALARNAKKQEQCENALFHYKKAVESGGFSHALYAELAQTYLMVGRVDEAIAVYDCMLSKSPSNYFVHHNKGYAYKMAGNMEASLAAYTHAIKLKPDYEDAYFSRARAYLTSGDFKTGWQQYDRYLKSLGRDPEPLRQALRTHSLGGKSVLIVPEGSLGDTLQFIRYAQEFKKCGARVIAVVQKPLRTLLQGCAGIDQLLVPGDRVPITDFKVTVMNAPAVFMAEENDIPCEKYIRTHQSLNDFWHKELAHDTNFKIGLCWQADVKNDESRMPVARRGIPLQDLAPLAKVPGVSLYSLQQVDGLDQLDAVAHVMHITQFGKDFDGEHGRFMDTAAVMQQMDLVISVDTAIAHLAGALQVPVWLLLPYATDWRWIAGSAKSPWYPTMTIFKQHKPFDWQGVVERVQQALQERVGTFLD